YSAATPVNEATTADKAGQTINVTTAAPANATYNTNFTVVASATSSLPVTFAAGGVCSNGGTATYTMTSGTGTCDVTLTQPGNDNYSAATPVNEATTADKADQTITVNPHAPATAAYATTFGVAATASSSLTVGVSAGPAGV